MEKNLAELLKSGDGQKAARMAATLVAWHALLSADAGRTSADKLANTALEHAEAMMPRLIAIAEHEAK